MINDNTRMQLLWTEGSKHKHTKHAQNECEELRNSYRGEETQTFVMCVLIFDVYNNRSAAIFVERF